MLSEELRTKMRRRVKRHIAGNKVHRVIETDGVIRYRLPGSMFNRGLRQGPKVLIRVDSIGRVYIPKEVDGGETV